MRKILPFAATLIIGCANGNCRENQAAKDKANPAGAAKVAQYEIPSGPLDRIRVYKYDGSLQCGMGKPIPLDEMKASLKGIKIYAAVNRADGLMHIQQCGTLTGKANVFEIEKKDLPTAKAQGFKEWVWD